MLRLSAVNDRAPDPLLRINGEADRLVWNAPVGRVMQRQKAVGRQAIQLGLGSNVLAEPCRGRLHQGKVSSDQIARSILG